MEGGKTLPDINKTKREVRFVITSILTVLYFLIVFSYILEFMKINSNKSLLILIIRLVVEASIIPAVFGIIISFPHEFMHSAMSRLILKDWGRVSFSFKCGYFYTDKPMNVSQFTLIAIIPFLFEMSFLLLLMSLLGNNYGILNFKLLILMSALGCSNDIAEIISYNLNKKQCKTIYLSEITNHP